MRLDEARLALIAGVFALIGADPGTDFGFRRSGETANDANEGPGWFDLV